MGRRPARSMRDMNKVAYTRYSKTKPRKSYIKAMPHRHLHMFNMGKETPELDTVIDLVSDIDIILRDCAIEAARVTVNKIMEKKLLNQYYFKVLKFAFHVVRENKMISGAGADRLSKGMRQSFGRAVDMAARVKKGDPVFRLMVKKENVELVKAALKLGINKLGGEFRILVYPNGPHD